MTVTGPLDSRYAGARGPVRSIGRRAGKAKRPFTAVLLYWLIALVVALSLVGTVSAGLTTTGVAGSVQMLRWPLLGIGAIVAFVGAKNAAMSGGAKAWLMSGLWAFGTVFYSFDVAPTVLRGVAFICIVLACVWGTEVLARSGEWQLLVGAIRFLARFFVVLFLGCVAAYFVAPSLAYTPNGYFRGILVHPNTLGVVAAHWLPSALMLAEQGRSRRGRVIAFAGFLAAVVAVVLSKSRTGMGASLAGCVVYYVATRKVSKIALVVVALTSALGLSLLVAPDMWGSTVTATEELVYKGREGDVMFSRRSLIETGLANFEKSPWFGFGFGTSPGETPEASEWKIVGLSGREKSNAFIASLEEVGVVGTAVMVMPIVMFLAMGLRLRRMVRPITDPRLLCGVAAYGGALGGFMTNMGESTLWSPGAMFSVMTFFLVGSALGLLAPAPAPRLR